MEETLDYFGMIKLLINHFGDGLVYLPEGANLELLEHARDFGHISDEGYLPHIGRQRVAEHE